jgi:anti-anti-sigma factor
MSLKDESKPAAFQYRSSEPIVVHEEIESADAHVVHVLDEIDIASSKQLEAEVFGVAARRRIVIELSDCHYMDSSGITVLMRAHQHFGQRLRIVVKADSSVARIILLLNLDKSLPLAASLQEALLDRTPATPS